MNRGFNILGVATGLVVWTYLGITFGPFPVLKWLVEYPWTRTYGLSIPIVQIILLASPRIREYIIGPLVAGPLVYACAAVAIAAGLVWKTSQSDFSSSIGGIVLAGFGLGCASPFGIVAVGAWRLRKRTTRDWVLGSLSAALLLAIPAADWLSRDRGFPGQLSRVVSQNRSGHRFDIATIQREPWVRMLVFGPYSEAVAIDQALGHTWHDRRRHSVSSSDVHSLFLFVDSKNEVLDAYEVPLHVVEFCAGGGYHEIGRTSAVFRVDDSRRGSKCLQRCSALEGHSCRDTPDYRDDTAQQTDED